ncbi:unnamed protein product, partial [Prorocentrum cordatum]
VQGEAPDGACTATRNVSAHHGFGAGPAASVEASGSARRTQCGRRLRRPTSPSSAGSGGVAGRARESTGGTGIESSLECKQARAEEGPTEHDAEKLMELRVQEEQSCETEIVGSDGHGQESVRLQEALEERADGAQRSAAQGADDPAKQPDGHGQRPHLQAKGEGLVEVRAQEELEEDEP